MNTERSLAKVVKITEILPHTNADQLELIKVDGWQIVVKKGDFQVGQLAIYLEIDSWVPHTLAPFLSKGKSPRAYNGFEGEKLRTIRLRGELSQGLLLPLNGLFTKYQVSEGQDVTELLGIQKYEKPVPANLSGVAKGNFPSEFPKTDQQRVQNLSRQLEKWKEKDLTFVVQEKLEGSSMTCYLLNGEFGVCSRNLDLERDEDNLFWKAAITQDIEAKMRNFFGNDTNVAIQGELIGEGIQGNIYNLKGHKFVLFDVVFSKPEVSYSNPRAVNIAGIVMGVEVVPFLSTNTLWKFKTTDNILKFAEGKSQLNPKQEREGVVFKCVEDPSITFKAISNKYLLNQKD